MFYAARQGPSALPGFALCRHRCRALLLLKLRVMSRKGSGILERLENNLQLGCGQGCLIFPRNFS